MVWFTSVVEGSRVVVMSVEFSWVGLGERLVSMVLLCERLGDASVVVVLGWVEFVDISMATVLL